MPGRWADTPTRRAFPHLRRPTGQTDSRGW
jgi:hypothetical protein